jgi:hypothetical protein
MISTDDETNRNVAESQPAPRISPCNISADISICLEKNGRYIGKSQSQRPPTNNTTAADSARELTSSTSPTSRGCRWPAHLLCAPPARSVTRSPTRSRPAAAATAALPARVERMSPPRNVGKSQPVRGCEPSHVIAPPRIASPARRRLLAACRRRRGCRRRLLGRRRRWEEPHLCIPHFRIRTDDGMNRNVAKSQPLLRFSS